MLVVSADQGDPVSFVGTDRPASGAGVACVFSGCAGMFHPAAGQTGVVMCSPWGFEDLAMRKGWRLLAEAIAAKGYPCLRFDYPGTGDSRGATIDIDDAATWVASINEGADFVRRVTGVRRFVFIGQTLGAALAVEAARTRGDVVGLHLIAPVVKGRAHVRELAVTATMVDERLGIASELADAEGLSVMGFALSRGMVDSLKSIDLTKIDSLGVENVVVYDQEGRKAAVEAVEHFRRLGARVALEPVEPYHLMVSDATVIQPLPVAADVLVGRIEAASPAVAAVPAPPAPTLGSVLFGETWREEPIRFGVGHGLFSMLCRSRRDAPDETAVILLNRGLNPHVGWRRVSVEHARALATAGITSLRIDVAGIGESRDAPGRPQDLIYSELLVPDIKAAVDALEARGFRRIVLAGVCSGAYMALAAAQADPRVAEVIAVNTQRFVWNPKESYEDVIRFGLRSMNDYVGDIRGGNALKKLVRSRKRLVPAMSFLLRRQLRDALAKVPIELRSALAKGSMAGRVQTFFSTFSARGTRVHLVYSAGDPGLSELRTYFGPDGVKLAGTNVDISIVPDADHNLTTTRASRWMLDHMLATLEESAARGEPRRAARAPRETRQAVCPT